MRNVPTYMTAMLLVTGVYLTIEIPFSVHLVRVMGGLATQADIDGIEKFGRLLTGIAVALAYVGIRTLPRMHARGASFRAAAVRAVLVGLPIVGGVYGGLHYYGEATGMFSSGETRKEAYIASLAKRAIIEDGIEGNHQASSDPSWLATVSGLPSIYGSDALVDMTGLPVEELARREAVRVTGTPAEAHGAFVKRLMSEMGPSYDEYYGASREYEIAISNSREMAERKWNEYWPQIERRFIMTPRPGDASHAEVIKRLRAEGMPVPRRFRLDDKATFMKIARAKVVQEADAAFDDGVSSALGERTKMARFLDIDAFFAHPGVQKAVRSKVVGLENAGKALITPSMELGDFERAVYPALVGHAAKVIAANAHMSSRQFTTRNNREMAEDAVKAATLPATALLLSMAGALFHIFKFSGYAVAIFGKIVRFRLISGGFVKHGLAFGALAAAVAVMSPSSPLAVESILNNGDNNGVFATVVSHTVRLQPGLAEVGDAMAEVGPWPLIARYLPQPRPVSVKPSAFAKADAAETVEVAQAEVSDIPIPSPAPR